LRSRTAFWLAWCTWGEFVAIATPALIFQIKNAPSAWLSGASASLTLLALATIGALVASRRPENPIGWIFCASAVLSVLSSGLLEYAVYALITAPGSLPAGAYVGVFGDALQGVAYFPIITFVPLLFPDGHLLSPRWRPLAWLIAALLAAWPILTLLSPSQSFIRLSAVRNPLGIPFADGLLHALTYIVGLVVTATVFPCIASMILRFRRAQGVERQQLKWFAYGVAVNALLIIALVALVVVVPSVPTAGSTAPFYLALVSIALASGVAILRYRLFDIDLLINLTLVYGLLSAILLAIYLVLVFGGQYLLSSRFGPNNAVVLVVSTLLVAALFQPLRYRVQQLVDQRFYRRRYDAARVMERFTEALRQEVDLEQVGLQLLQVVQETMQPAYLSLWLAPTMTPAQSDESEDKRQSTPEVS
jgi:hypothetical protein